MTDLIHRLRQLAALGVEIAGEAADAIELAHEERRAAQIEARDAIEARNRSGLDVRVGEVQPLRDALAWYAETGNWKRPTRGRSWSNSPAADDRGSLARMALMEGVA